VPLTIPSLLSAFCAQKPERRAWLAALPETIRRLQERWELSLDTPFDHEYVSCSWVAPATRTDGTRAVLKIGMPHMEGEQEIDGLRFWNGQGCVRLLERDSILNAMLLERCEPGTALLALPEEEQDAVIAAMLKRFRRTPPSNKFRPLSTLVDYWREETLTASANWPDPGLVNAGLQMMQQLAATPHDEVLLVTDLHAGNVLRAQREPWLMIDPKPFVGDPAYDATQHLLNCERRLKSDPFGLISRIASLSDLGSERLRLWLFARAAAEPRMNWNNWKLSVARQLAP
jgi:streptomycin 6-kinase